MTDLTQQTTRFGFQKYANGTKPLEPNDYESMLDRVDANLSETPLTFTPNTGAVVTYNRPRAVQKLRLTLTAFDVLVPAANDYGGTKLFDQASNLLIVGAEVNVSTVKDGVTNGLVAATDIAVALGTVVASNTTLSATMANVLASQAITADQLTNTLQAHSLAASPAFAGLLDGAPTSSVFLNVSAAAGITADSHLLVTGTVDIYYIDLGNETSPS